MQTQDTLPIPASFRLFGNTIDIEMVDDLRQNHGAVGRGLLEQNLIQLQPDCDGYRRNHQDTEQTFLHEMVHFILYKMWRHDLCDDERFVEVFSQLLHQALTTQQFS